MKNRARILACRDRAKLCVLQKTWRLFHPRRLALYNARRNAQNENSKRAATQHMARWGPLDDMLVMSAEPAKELARELGRTLSAVNIRRVRLRKET
jgi:hypothetical protein